MSSTKPSNNSDGPSSSAGTTPKDALVHAMERVDPFLRFLTKATGKTMVPLQMLQKVLPRAADSRPADTSSTAAAAAAAAAVVDLEKSPEHVDNQYEILLELTHRGVLHYDPEKSVVGFPQPPSNNAPDKESPKASLLPKPPAKLIGKGLHGSSEAVAKRRMKVLLWTLDKESRWICRLSDEALGDVQSDNTKASSKMRKASPKKTRLKRTALDALDVASAKPNIDLEETQPQQCFDEENVSKTEDDTEIKTNEHDSNASDEINSECSERVEAFKALHNLFCKKSPSDSTDKSQRNLDDELNEKPEQTKHWLPCQAAFAGSQPGRDSRYGVLSKDTLDKIPSEVLPLFHLNLNETTNGKTKPTSIVDNFLSKNNRKLFLHQAQAIEAAMNGIHTVVCTSTGSGKSMCFLLPVIAKALSSLKNGDIGSASILMFPTKALAQDQLTKINAMLKSLPPGIGDQLCAGVIDGDTPHTQRDTIASECQIILTNPDTLHAAILPNWKRPAYKQLLERVRTVVIDEAHVYEGTFGAHVALVLARLRRICRVASSGSTSNTTSPLPLFIACSATMTHPEEHFRALCPISAQELVCVLAADQDGSPCSPKHFFVWNPPILDVNGNSTESVFLPKKSKIIEDATSIDTDSNSENHIESVDTSHCKGDKLPFPANKRRKKANSSKPNENDISSLSTKHNPNTRDKFTRRRHAADETAFLLAKAITCQIRCIVFCKTRCLVEWVYEKAISQLCSSDTTSHLTARIESYRGGYSAQARRSIEERFFRGDLWGVVATNAFELGVDVGDIDLTLHCGYPGSRSSLLQQAGRSGRGTGMPSCSILISFSSPSEQYLWKVPRNILAVGVNVIPSLPTSGTVLQGHLLCAGEEFPLTGDQPVSCILNEIQEESVYCPPDDSLFGLSENYNESVDNLTQRSLLRSKTVCAMSNNAVEKVVCKETHPVMKNAWKRVNLRSIEPLNYVIVDISHPLQARRTDKLVDSAAVLDTIPYSRVFYHAFPGAIITHRGTRYKIESMESPPPFLGAESFGRSKSTDLCSFAKPVQVNYSTQALSISEITVVKELDSIELHSINEDGESKGMSKISTKLAGRGTVNVKRSVHGYKKLSLVHRKEISRSSIVLPSMEFDTHAFWVDADATTLREIVKDFDAGVHALSHALVAVAPTFTPCTSADIDCDHSRFECTRIVLFDSRAGGSGMSHTLFNQLIEMLEAAIDLLYDCTLCSVESKYEGGCPGCLQSIPCDNFQEDLSRTAALSIGRYLLKRLKESATNRTASPRAVMSNKGASKEKDVLIGRPSWMDNGEHSGLAEVDE